MNKVGAPNVCANAADRNDELGRGEPDPYPIVGPLKRGRGRYVSQVRESGLRQLFPQAYRRQSFPISSHSPGQRIARQQPFGGTRLALREVLRNLYARISQRPSCPGYFGFAGGYEENRRQSAPKTGHQDPFAATFSFPPDAARKPFEPASGDSGRQTQRGFR